MINLFVRSLLLTHFLTFKVQRHKKVCRKIAEHNRERVPVGIVRIEGRAVLNFIDHVQKWITCSWKAGLSCPSRRLRHATFLSHTALLLDTRKISLRRAAVDPNFL